MVGCGDSVGGGRRGSGRDLDRGDAGPRLTQVEPYPERVTDAVLRNAVTDRRESGGNVAVHELGETPLLCPEERIPAGHGRAGGEVGAARVLDSELHDLQAI